MRWEFSDKPRTMPFHTLGPGDGFAHLGQAYYKVCSHNGTNAIQLGTNLLMAIGENVLVEPRNITIQTNPI